MPAVRPRRYFLLENVRNFVSFNKGATFRTAVRTLIEIGYQVGTRSHTTEETCLNVGTVHGAPAPARPGRCLRLDVRLSDVLLCRCLSQVRFGVLNAGFYGCAQSRKRAFLFAAAPGEVMPDWCASPRLPRCTQSRNFLRW